MTASLERDLFREWLEADGLGGFASGTAALVRSRRYHGLLLVAATPPTGRAMLVNGLDAFVTTPRGTYALSTQAYAPAALGPDGATRIESFTAEPWPRWVFRLEDGTVLAHELFAVHGSPLVALSWKLMSTAAGESVRLEVKPFLSGRDIHALHFENSVCATAAREEPGQVSWQPYAAHPRIVAAHSGSYAHGPAWYRNFLYSEERARGLDHVEDLLMPGSFHFELRDGAAVLLLGTEAPPQLPAAERYQALRHAESLRRNAFPSRAARSADAYLVQRGSGRTVIAGYPWFTDWGRDTFIALRGLCLGAGRFDDARRILLEWAGTVSEGMLPNRFVESGEAPEYNAADASLWFVVALGELLALARAGKASLPPAEAEHLREAARAVLEGYLRGTRYGIRADEDGLIAEGEAGLQLTWMDARVEGHVVTPRIGKPVELQALWANALAVLAPEDVRYEAMLGTARASFEVRFWDEQRGHLADVVDDGHRHGARDSSLRPNQILAVGGLPLALLTGPRARRVVDVVEERLWTPLGLRTLAPGEQAYRGRYEGSVRARDEAYHQGAAWPWLLGPFVDAWLRVRGNTAEARETARARFFAPLVRHLDEAGIGHVSELCDGDAPHTPRGCPFQAWSLGALLDIERLVSS